MDLVKYGLNIQSDFNMRILREDDLDIDIIIPLDNRTVDLHFDNMPNYFINRIQCPMIKNIILRLSKLTDNSLCTVHLLRSIDLHSSIINFEIDYNNLFIEIVDLGHSVAFKIIKSK